MRRSLLIRLPCLIFEAVVASSMLPPYALTSLKVIVNLAGELQFFEGTLNVIRFYSITSML